MKSKSAVILGLGFSLIISLSLNTQADTFVQGAVSGVWRAQDSPYIAAGTIYIPNRSALAIEPGVTVRFSPNTGFFIYGRLSAVGSEEDSIYFRPIDEGQVWLGLRAVDPDSVFRLDYCVITGGQATRGQAPADTANSGGNLFIHRGNSLLTHCRFSGGRSNGFGAGIAMWAGQAVIEQCLINENQSLTQGGGLNVRATANATVRECAFIQNTAGWGGGGMNVEENGVGLVESSLFLENRGQSGGGIALYGTRLTCRKSKFISNHAVMGGGAYVRNEGNAALFDWCDFIENHADMGDGVGGAMIVRFFIDLETRCCRFIGNDAIEFGGAIYFQGRQRARFHNNLFISNQAQGRGGAIATGNDLGEAVLEFPNNTFLDNRSFGGEANANIAFGGGSARLSFRSCILWGPSPHFFNTNFITATYCQTSENYRGQGNSAENPLLFDLDLSWALLRGDSPCRDSGDPNLANDPDGTRNDRGWMFYPANAAAGLEQNLLSVNVELGRRLEVPVRFENRTAAPIFVSPMDLWREGNRELMFNLTDLTGDANIEAAVWTQDGFYIAGGNSGRDPNKIYCLDYEINLRRQFDQPGGVNGAGFLDLAGDGSEIIYAGDTEQIVEFTTNGELGEQLEGPDVIDVFRAVGINYNNAEEGLEFFLGGNEGYIVRTDAGLWEQERILVGDTVHTLACKPNDRALYIVTSPRPGLFVLSLVTLDDGKVRALYTLRPLTENAIIGGIEVTQDWRPERGSLVGIWKQPNNDDWLFVIDLYSIWLNVRPEWILLMPGERAEWTVQFAADQVERIGRYQSELYLAVNGYGEEGQITAIMQVTPAGVNPGTPPKEFGLLKAYPNPFNGKVRFNFGVQVPGMVSFDIFNASGDLVTRHKQFGITSGTNNWTWNAAGLSSGTYLVIVQTADGSSIIRPLVHIK